MLGLILALALACFALTRAVRETPYALARVGTKPTWCNVCCSLWSALLASFAWSAWRAVRGDGAACMVEFPFLWGGAFGSCLLLLEWSESMAPPAPPRLE